MTTNKFGVNVWWTVPELSIDGKRAQEILVKHGFTADDIKLPSRRAVVSRAAYSFQERRKKNSRRYTEKAMEDGTRVVYGILGRQQDETDEVSFDQDTTIRFDKGTGAVQVEGKLSAEVSIAVANFEDKVIAQDIRGFLRRIICMTYGVAKRPSGGIYFVPSQFQGVVESAQAVLRDFDSNAKLYIEEVVNGSQNRQNIWESVEEEVRGQIAEVTATVNNITKRVSAIADQSEKINGLKELVGVYQNLLGEEAKYESLAEEIESAVKIVASKMSQLKGESASVVANKISAPSAKTAMSWTAAAERILATATGPMHYTDITKQAISEGLVAGNGKTPQNTMSAALGKSDKLVRIGKGLWSSAVLSKVA